MVTGSLLSPTFKLQLPFVNYLVAGPRDLPARLGVELLVDGKVVRAASATEIKDSSKAMDWRTWDVRDLKGKNAQIRVNDQSTLASIAVDSFTQSDTAKGLPVDASMLGYESLRPQYHYTALSGWLNDANNAGAANPAGYGPMLQMFGVLSLLALVSTLALWRREQGPNSHGLDRPVVV